MKGGGFMGFFEEVDFRCVFVLLVFILLFILLFIDFLLIVEDGTVNFLLCGLFGWDFLLFFILIL